MLKITNAALHRFGQSFFDEIEDVDWGEGVQDPRKRTPYVSKEDAPPVPHGEQGIIGEDAFENFEPGTVEETPEGREEIPFGNQELGIPEGTQETEYDDAKQLVYDGIDRGNIISFDYTNRFGMYAGTRTVEPHYTFVAETTQNEVLVTWDIDQNDIRAFIVGNIHPFGVRYEGTQFQGNDPGKLGKPREEIMRGIY